ncbi:MAG: DUF3343 domain-containing protein [Eubacteriales bacterium]|nr:DUF3343 domain-containing protein [Eubacteriales bacterium]
MREDYYVMFHSVTVATGVKKALEKRGISAILLHSPKSIQMNGCSYSLRIKANNYQDVVDAASQTGADIMAVFKSVDGDFREVQTP